MSRFQFVPAFAAAALALASALPIEAEEASLAIKAAAPGNVFTDSVQPLFDFAPGVAKRALSYEVSDWRGASVAKGGWDGGSPLVLKGLQKGCYSLKFPSLDGELPFGIVADPAKCPVAPDSYFAMDTAQSWLAAPKANNPRQPKDGFATVSELCRLAGIFNVRERMSWNEVAKSPYQLDWGRYMVNAKLLSERGIGISGMFHDSAKWAKSPNGKLPGDLMALHEFCRLAAIAFKGKMNAWEFWNEEDIGFCDQPAWDFASCQKAAYLGFKAGLADVPVLNGALCAQRPGVFAERLFENGMGDYMDVFNYHVYGPFPDYPKSVAAMKDLLARHGRSDAPVWLTENGSSYEGTGKLDSFIQGVKEHDKAQELSLAEFAPKAQILMQAQGVARDYFFVLPAYNERGGSKSWGLLRYDYSAKPAFFAFANMAKLLADAKLLGELKLAKGVRAFLYEKPDKSQTLAFWSESEMDLTAKTDPDAALKNDCAVDAVLKAKAQGKLTLVDLVGAESAVEAKDGSIALRATRYPAYLTGLSGLAPSEKAPAVPAVQLSRKTAKDLSIVLKLELGEGFRADSKVSSSLLSPKGKLVLEIWNFSPEWKRGSVKASGGARVEGLPESVELPPYGKLSLPCVCVPEKGSAFTSNLDFNGSFNGKEISPLRANILFEELFASSSEGKSLSFADPARWRKNSSGDMKIAFDEAEKAVRFDVKFPKDSDHWIYPEYVVSKDAESLKGALGVSFEIKAVQSGGSSEYAHKLLMAVTQNVHETGEKTDFEYRAPGKEWSRVRVLFADVPGFDPADVKILRLGLNPKGDELTYWVRDMQVLYSK